MGYEDYFGGLSRGYYPHSLLSTREDPMIGLRLVFVGFSFEEGVIFSIRGSDSIS